HHARGHPVLAVLAELGPQLDHGGIEIEFAAAGQHVRAQRRRALGAGKDDADRIAGPRRSGLGIGNAAPPIDHRFAVYGQADRSADLGPAFEVPGKGFGDTLEAWLARALDHVGTGSLKTSSRKRAACDSAVSLMP